MAVHRLIYASKPFGFDAAMLGGIMIAARRNNARDGITGALICRADVYLQLLEGPRDAVIALYSRINRDDRHLDVEQLCGGDADGRLFPAWAMLDDPARSWLWSPAEIAAGDLAAASPAAVTEVFERVAAARGSPDSRDPAAAAAPARTSATCPVALSA